MTQKTKKPQKPYPEFPLFAHANGQWCKTIKGKHWHFGLWNDPDAALQRYLDEGPIIRSGRDPRVSGTAEDEADITVAEMMNRYIDSQSQKRDREEITNRHFKECFDSCKIVVEFFGKVFAVSALRSSDFAALRASFPATWGPTKTGTEIQRMRTAFKWACDSELIENVPKFGPNFEKPSKSVGRRARATREQLHGTLDYTSEELRTILEAAETTKVDASLGWLRASILLGINAGFGAADCARLRNHNIADNWYSVPRLKTGIPRRFYVWPETVQAIENAAEKRKAPKYEEDKELAFLTSHGRPLWFESATGARTDNLANAFRKLLKSIGDPSLIRPGRGFYSLRRTYETVAGNSRDQIAVNLAMGHTDESMAAVYRQGIDDQRLIDVAEHVRAWLWPELNGE